MKKLLALMMAVAMTACLLTACSKDQAGSDGEDQKDNGGKGVTLEILEAEYTTEDYAIAIAKDNTELLEQVDAALQELIADGTVQAVVDKYISGVENDLVFQQDADGKPELHMATNAEFPPYEYYDDESIVGIDAEVAAAIADKLGMKLVIDDMAFDATITAVQTGKADMVMAGLTVTEEREEQVNFTTSYATGVQVIIVREGDTKIAGTNDDLQLIDADGNVLEGLTIGVQSTTTGDLYSTWYMEDEGLATVQRYNKGADAVAALVSGKIDCVIIDNEPAKAFVEANNK